MTVAADHLLRQAIAHNAAGRLAQAEDACRQVLRLAPDQPIAEHLLGVVLCRQGRLTEGAQVLGRLSARRPTDADVLGHLVDALHGQGAFAAAADAAARLVALVPADGAACHRLGLAAQAAGRLEQAAQAFGRAATLTPDDAAACLLLGDVLCDLDRHEQALAAYGQALQRHPDWPEATTNAGLALAALGRLDDAVAVHSIAVRTAPTLVSAWTNLGAALQMLGRVAEAEAAYARALALAPDDALVLSNLAQVRDENGLAADAIDLHRRAVAADPTSGVAHFNLGLALLRAGQFVEGWREYAWRWRGGVPKLRPRNFGQPEWDGGPCVGRVVLVHAEQGFGDTVQFVRFLPLLAARGAHVVLEVQPALRALLTGLPGTVQVVVRGDSLPPFDLHVPLLSLPGVLGVDEAALAAPRPYLVPPAAAVARWQDRLGEDGTPRVAVVWSGNPQHRADRQRSIPAAQVLGALAHSPVRLFSLQKPVRESDRAAVAAAGARLVDLGAELHDFTDTAAVLARMDLVIAVDTAVAHLAGALGRPLWLLLPDNADWRWQRGRTDSPWYPTARLFRQTAPGDWPGVLERVAAALAAQF